MVFHAFHWWTPETPVWQRSLVVTPWMTDEPVSPWRWDPAGFFDAGQYWLKEADAGFEPGTLRVADKTSFFVFVQLAVMVVMAALTVRCGLLTFAMVLRQWWPHRRWAVLLLAGLSGGTGAAVSPQWHFDAVRSRREQQDRPYRLTLNRVRAEDLARREVRPLFDSLIMHRAPLPSERSLARALSSDFHWVDDSIRTPAELTGWAVADHEAGLRERRTTDVDQAVALVKDNSTDPPEKVDGNRDFRVAHSFLEYLHPEGGGIEVRYRRVIWQGTIRPPARVKVTRVRQTLIPFYVAGRQSLTASGAEQWLSAFLAAMAEPGCPRLETFFTSSFLRASPAGRCFPPLKPSWRCVRNASGGNSCSSPWPRHCRPPVEGTGGRWELRPALRQGGTRSGDGPVLSGISFTPSLDIAWIGVAWRMIRFTF